MRALKFVSVSLLVVFSTACPPDDDAKAPRDAGAPGDAGEPHVGQDAGPAACTVEVCSDDSVPCELSSASFASGSTNIPALDGCSTCKCNDGKLECNDEACAGFPRNCEHNGWLYADQYAVLGADPCNTCTCKDGQMACTDQPCGVTDCVVAGTRYPEDAEGIKDPFSCNTCTCLEGQLACTSIDCDEPCPEGTAPNTACADCNDSSGRCFAIETGCMPTCAAGTDASCPGTDYPLCEADGVCTLTCG